jgi:transposase
MQVAPGAGPLNRAPRGRKRDFQDAERLVRRFLANELTLSFVQDPQQRLWRTLTRSKHQLARDRVRLYGQLESLLGVSSRRMLQDLADGETDPAKLAAMADPGLRAAPERLADALGAASSLSSLHRQILRLFLERLELIEREMAELKLSIASSLQNHQAAVMRLAAVPGFGIDSAQQVIAEVGLPRLHSPAPGSWLPGRSLSRP